MSACEDRTFQIEQMTEQVGQLRWEIGQLQITHRAREQTREVLIAALQNELETLRNYRCVVGNAEGLADAAIADDTVNHSLLDDVEERNYIIRLLSFVHARALEMSAQRDSTCS